jgi:cytoskeletal protein RodZ
MDSFGEFLRRERELRHIELNEISKITKIKKAYLQAIETDTYDELPDIAFVKGFIRAYCNYIGLDPEQTINYFQQFYDENFNQTTKPQKKSFNRGINQQKIVIPAAIGLLLAGIIFVVIYQVSKSRSNRHIPGYKNHVQQLNSTSTTPAQLSTQAATAITQSALSEITTTGTPLTMTVRQHTLLLKATENTWVRLVPNDEENAGQEALLQAGEQVLWKFTGTAMLTVGNAEGLNIILDNKKIQHSRIKAEVIRLKLSD